MDGGSQPERGLESEGWAGLNAGVRGFVESPCMVGWLIDGWLRATDDDRLSLSVVCW